MLLGQHAQQLVALLSTPSVFITNLTHELSDVIVTLSILKELVVYLGALKSVVLD